MVGPWAVRWFGEIQLGVRTLLLHKLRSSLTMLGMVFGVSSVIAMLAVGEGASAEALREIRKLGSNNLIVSSVKPVDELTADTARTRMSIYGLRYADFDRIKDSIPHVSRTVPVKLLRQEGQLGRQTLELRMVGTTPDWFQLVRRPLLAGRVLDELDLERRQNVAVLTENGARRLLATHHSLGESLRIGGVLFRVIGITTTEESAGGQIQSPDRDVDAYIPITVARSRFGDIQTRRTAGEFMREMVELHQLIVEVDALEHVEETAEAIEFLLGRFHEKKDFAMQIPLALLRQAEATQRTFNVVLGSIASISLLVGGIGIMNIMLASVTERTREIGVRRALGAKRRQIIRQFLIETVVLSTTGGIVGMTIGVLVPAAITRMADMPTIVTSESLLLALGISMAVGIIFGLYPAARAAALDPIVALRHE
jgi:putative ABC transport system permease protein